jgi:DNA primase large subunit
VRAQDAESVSIDAKSHHILRLAYANTEEKRRWLVQHESVLLQARLRRESPDGVTAFMARHNFDFTPVDDDEARALEPELRRVWEAVGQGRAEPDVSSGGGGGEGGGGGGAEDEAFEAATFFKVPFTQAMELVRGRRVLLRGGLAYVPRGRITAIVLNRFGAYLRMMLAASNRALPEALQDERLKPLLELLSTAYVGTEFGAKRAGDKVSAAEVDALAAPGPTGAFPLCMQAGHDALRREAHLRHGARLALPHALVAPAGARADLAARPREGCCRRTTTARCRPPLTPRACLPPRACSWATDRKSVV